mmetsp:Transcript_55383/g.160814  ORF Transcript_55383/g.160814 Transcript_55383/m.160814 type:complete len:325 (+) Transcript_55383:59-1033(+)
MASSTRYSCSEDSGGADRPVKVCAEAGRRCVRSIQQHEVLSREWLDVVDALKQLARLVVLEGRLPANLKAVETVGRNPDTEGTLWDQEANENAIRILIEEAKGNLCLRLMNDFKKWQYDAGLREAAVARAMREADLNEASVAYKMQAFEESMGLLLWRAFVHVETLQLMDIPLLIEHCAMVLDHCERERKEALSCTSKEQELIVMYYVCSLFKHAEALINSEVLARVREARIVPLSISHAASHAAAEYADDFKVEVALGFSALCDNEDFQTDWVGFFDNPDVDMANFMQLGPLLVDPILAAQPEKRRELRPMTDFFGTLARKLG